MARNKIISEEERRARAQLKSLGVSEYELTRLYDANYKLRTRAKASGASEKELENISLKWTNILKGARQNIRRGGTASEYIQARASGSRQQFRFSSQKKLVKERVLYTEESGSWRARALNLLINETSSAELKRAENEAIDDLIESGDIDAVTGSEIYANAKKRYVAIGGNSQSDWDRCLSDAATEFIDDYTEVNDVIADKLGWDLEGIDEAQQMAEEEAASLYGSVDINNPRVRAFLERRFREAVERFRSVKYEK